MKEISLNILDIAENSIKAGATHIDILITEIDSRLSIEITDNGCGMEPDTLKSVTDPFYTTRKTRTVGLGLPLFKLQAEQTGGEMVISSLSRRESEEGHGTKVKAVFLKEHIDCPPLGDIISTLVTLIQGNPERDFFFTHRFGEKTVELNTTEIRSVLGEVSLAEYEVIKWIEEYMREQYTL